MKNKSRQKCFAITRQKLLAYDKEYATNGLVSAVGDILLNPPTGKQCCIYKVYFKVGFITLFIAHFC